MAANKRIDTNQLFWEGLANRQEKHDEYEAGKVGNLRGGETGVLFPNGTVGHSKCARLIYARSAGIDLGIFSEDDKTKELMFNAGRMNEDGWFDSLSRVWDRGAIKREEEIPVEWYTSNGRKVTGRPDMVLCDGDEPVQGLEFKGVFSVWTARDVLNDKPRVTALMQAAHYSMGLGSIPFDVHYTSRGNFHTIGTGKPENGHWPTDPKLLPEGSYDDRGYLYGIKPFNRTWTLDWAGDQLLVNNKLTVITQSGIKNFYEMLSKLDDEGAVFPKETVHFDRHTGEQGEKAWAADKYCPLKGSGFCCVDKDSCSNVKEWRESLDSHVQSLKGDK